MPRKPPKIPKAQNYLVQFSDGTTTLYRNWQDKKELENFIIATEKAYPIAIFKKKQQEHNFLKSLFSLP